MRKVISTINCNLSKRSWGGCPAKVAWLSLTSAVLASCEVRNCRVYPWLSLTQLSAPPAGEGQSTGLTHSSNLPRVWFWKWFPAKASHVSLKRKMAWIILSSSLVPLYCLFPSLMWWTWGKVGNNLHIYFKLFIACKVLQFYNCFCMGFLHFLIQHPFF